MATEAGAATVGIYPKLVGAAGIASQLSSAFSGVGNVAKSALSGAVTSISAVTAGVAGLAATGGISRALNIEQAQTTFKGLGLAWDDYYSTIMQSVDGTAYGFDVAARASAQLAASGVAAGDDMQKALNGCVGAAATYGADLGDLSGIWAKVAAKGKLTGEQLMQFTDRGINATSVLASYLNKTQAEVSSMVTAGQIDFNTFSNAMYAAFGESAQGANNTFTGAMANIKAALSKIGADFFTPLKDGCIPVFNSLRGVINSVRTALAPLVERFSAFLGVSYDANGNLTRTAGAAQTLADWIDQLAQKIGTLDLGNLSGGAKALAAAFGAVGALSVGNFLSQIPIIGQAFGGLTGNIIPAFTNAISGIPARLSGMAGAFTTAFSGAGEGVGVLGRLGAGFGALFSPATLIVGAIAAVAGIFAYCFSTNEEFRNGIIGLVEQIGNGLAPCLEAFKPLAEPLKELFQNLCTVVMQLVPIIGSILAALAPVISTLVMALVPVIQAVIEIINAILPVVTTVLTLVAGLLAQILPVIVQTIVPVIEQISSVIQAVLPVIVDLITQGMTMIQGIIQAVWPLIEVVITTVMGIIQSVISIIMAAINGDWDGVWNGIKNLVQTVWDGIKGFIDAAINAVKGVIESVMNGISGAWQTAWGAISGFLGGVWDGIKNAVSAGIDGVLGFFRDLPGNILNALGNLGGLLWDAGVNIVKGLKDGIENAIKGVFDFVGGIGDTIASLKGPKPYDLRLLIPNGQWIMQSLSTGLEKGMDGVRDTLGDITAGISDFGFSGAMDAALASVETGVSAINDAINGGMEQARTVAFDARATYAATASAAAGNAGGVVLNVDGAVVNSRPEIESSLYSILTELRRLGYMQGRA